jgi:molecular chaperone HscB
MSGVNPISLQANDFELFDLPARFELDTLELAKRWKALQALTHPDKFVSSTGADQRMAMQRSVRVNEAYQQMQLREDLDDASGNPTALQRLADVALAAKKEWLNKVATALDVDNDAAAGASGVRALMFIERVAKDINQQLDDAA